jgi:hypothetical protein
MSWKYIVWVMKKTENSAKGWWLSSAIVGLVSFAWLNYVSIHAAVLYYRYDLIPELKDSVAFVWVYMLVFYPAFIVFLTNEHQLYFYGYVDSPEYIRDLLASTAKAKK